MGGMISGTDNHRRAGGPPQITDDDYGGEYEDDSGCFDDELEQDDFEWQH